MFVSKAKIIKMNAKQGINDSAMTSSAPITRGAIICFSQRKV